MPDVEIRVSADPAAAVAGLLVEAARAGGHLALSGGSSPPAAFEQAAAIEPDWSRATVWWGDERCVPPHSPDSNYGMAKRTLLDRLSVRPRVERIEGELDPDEAARRYEEKVAGLTLDLALQGIGPDGHTASLFPGKPAVAERERRVVSTPPGLEPFVDRVTMTVPMLCESRLVLFLVTGESKAEPARRAFTAPPSPATPASLVRSREGRTVAILDAAAASLLDS